MRQLIKVLKRSLCLRLPIGKVLDEERRLGPLVETAGDGGGEARLWPSTADEVRPIREVREEYAARALELHGGNLAATARANPEPPFHRPFPKQVDHAQDTTTDRSHRCGPVSGRSRSSWAFFEREAEELIQAKPDGMQCLEVTASRLSFGHSGGCFEPDLCPGIAPYFSPWLAGAQCNSGGLQLPWVLFRARAVRALIDERHDNAYFLFPVPYQAHASRHGQGNRPLTSCLTPPTRSSSAFLDSHRAAMSFSAS